MKAVIQNRFLAGNIPVIKSSLFRVGRGGGAGADRVYMESLCRLTMTHATNSGGRTPGSKLPASPPPWPSRPAGRRAKQPQVPKHNKLNTEPVQMKSRGNLNATLDRNQEHCQLVPKRGNYASHQGSETRRAPKHGRHDKSQGPKPRNQNAEAQHEPPKE